MLGGIVQHFEGKVKEKEAELAASQKIYGGWVSQAFGLGEGLILE